MGKKMSKGILSEANNLQIPFEIVSKFKRYIEKSLKIFYSDKIKVILLELLLLIIVMVNIRKNLF